VNPTEKFKKKKKIVQTNKEPFQSRSQMTVSDSSAFNPTATSSGSRTMPHIQHLLTSLQVRYVTGFIFSIFVKIKNAIILFY
jgi:hypothetical protein